jgi:hypothetical protein
MALLVSHPRILPVRQGTCKVIEHAHTHAHALAHSTWSFTGAGGEPQRAPCPHAITSPCRTIQGSRTHVDDGAGPEKSG